MLSNILANGHHIVAHIKNNEDNHGMIDGKKSIGAQLCVPLKAFLSHQLILDEQLLTLAQNQGLIQILAHLVANWNCLTCCSRQLLSNICQANNVDLEPTNIVNRQMITGPKSLISSGLSTYSQHNGSKNMPNNN